MISKCPFHQQKLQLQQQQQEIQQQEAVPSEQCPVIQNINDKEAEEEGVKYEKASPFDFDEEFEDEIPSMREYKKLKRNTSLITDFYRGGSKLKAENYRIASEDLAKVTTDIQMAKDQLNALLDNQSFKGHLKYKELKEEIENDIRRLELEQNSITEHQQKMKDLMEWSKGIVQICEWLEANLDNYCKEHLDLPSSVLKNIKPVAELTLAQKEEYSKGLDEIMHNLNESRDFFQAAVDGRLDKYYEIEKKICESQLESLAKYSSDNARRQYVEASLKEDLAHAEAQLASGLEVQTQKRRQKMLDMHLNFLKVLHFFKNKLGILNEGDRMTRNYDASYSVKFNIGA